VRAAQPTGPSVDSQRRKQLGAWYTPPAIVEAVVREVVTGLAPAAGLTSLTVLDPACGDGRFLHSFARCAAHPVRLVGTDIDAAAIAALTPSNGEWLHADALRHDWGEQQFDAVIGNPPFLGQLRTTTSRGGSSRFGGGPYADAAAEFLALAVQLVRPGGRVGLVLPQSLLSSRDVAAIRRVVDEQAAMRWMWWSPTSLFDANVRVWAGVWEVGEHDSAPVRRAYGPDFTPVPPMAMPRVWSGLIGESSSELIVARPDGKCLGDIATFTADFRDQYYGLVGCVGDNVDGPPLVTSGLIEPGRCLWGERSTRFAKQRYDRPRVDVGALSPALQRWAEQRLVPKILIANQTREIEAVFDEGGEWLPSVPVITCISAQPELVMHVLASKQANDWVRYHAAGSGLSASAVRLSARLLASIPMPPE
jgi:SAM-dependent methyltransferase